ncbi:MAG: phage minor head protein [Sinobacteraceae bacterium]|nr:phage minor head protein [Nevskiaceae bacterium]
MAAVSYGSLPFSAQIEFFRSKLNLDTDTWADIRNEAHARAFVVAGARGDVLADFRQAVDKAISQGTTLAEFRKDFDRIVATYGWSYNGSRNWRSAVIYHTNLRTAYAAGRYRQLQEVKDSRPYWEFHHTPVRYPRLQHVAWDGIVLHADDPWWKTHYPPLGWGCQCVVYSRAEEDLPKLGKDGPDEAPKDEYYEVQNGPFKGTKLPVGIDPGWGHNIGEAAWGRQLAESAWRDADRGWEPLDNSPKTASNWYKEGRPKDIPLDPVSQPLGPRLDDRQAVADAIEKALGSRERVFDIWGYPVLVDADVLARHLPLDRSEFVPLIGDALTDPYEVWLSFFRNKATGKVALRARVIKSFEIGKGRGLLIVLDAQNGALVGHTFFPAGNQAYLRKQRYGLLLYGRQ